MKRSWLLVILVIVLTGLWILFGYRAIGWGNSEGRSDLGVYYTAATVVAGQTALQPVDIYHKQRFRPLAQSTYGNGGTYFLYPPQAAVLLLPLAGMPFRVVVLYWFAVNSALLIMLVYVWLYLLKPSMVRSSWWLLLLAAAPPIFKVIEAGQINLILLLLFTVAWVGLMKRQYPWLVGMCLGLAAVIKIFPVIFLPYLILKKQYKAAIGFMITCIITTLATLPWFKLHGWKVFLFDRLPDVLNGSIGFSEDSISMYGSLRTSILEGSYQFLGSRTKEIVAATDTSYKVVVVLVGVLLVYYLWRQRHLQTPKQYLAEYSLILLYIILTSEIVHQHYIIWLIPTFIGVSNQWGRSSIWWKGVYILTLVLVLFSSYLPFLSISDPYIKGVTLGLLMLVGCVYYVLCAKPPLLSPRSHS